ncbi:MAG: RHS repeat-associated core domain-containing protein [Kiritimatiellia bacterium]
MRSIDIATLRKTSYGWEASETTSYPHGISDFQVHTDARGLVTQTAFTQTPAETIRTTDTFDGSALLMRTTSRTVRGGGSTTRREWDGEWTEASTTTTFAPDGRRIEIATLATSDAPTVTNSVVEYDFLGRIAASETPLSRTEYAYHGSSRRIASETEIRSGSVATPLYDELGDAIGSVADGVASMSLTTYELRSNVWWRVATSFLTADGRTNGLSVSRTRLTGLSNALRSCVETEADGATTRVATSFDPVAKVSTDTLERTGMATTTRKRMFGREIEATDADGVTRYNYFDPYGRVYLTREFTGERFHWRTLAMRDSVGDVYASARFIGGTPHWNNVARFNGFDARGNLVASTNEMGCIAYSLFDSAGRLAVRFGAVHPVGYGYDATGRLKSLFTTRDGATWDVTQWNYDPATGLVTNKVHADGSTLAHGWTADGLPERTTWVRGAWRHVAYNDRRLPAAVSYSDPGTPGHELSYDAFGRLVAVADAAGRRHGYAYGASAASPTNETAAADSATNAIARILDANGRSVSTTLRVSGAPRGGTWHAYADSGRLAQVAATNAQGRGLVAAYTNFAGRSFGHSVELPSGAVFTRTLARDAYRPNRVTSIVHAFDGVEVSRYAHTFDALDRLAARNADAFGYNARSEVVSATVASNEYAYAYDHIGNHTTSSVNSATTAYTANALNQYTSFSNLVQSCNPVHDLDGNMLTNGVWSYTWDCENRLVTVSSNNVCVVSNAYDYLSRRVLKATPEAVHAFVYDGWNLIHETVTAGNGDVSEIQYFWGPDLSGTLQGAGGVGGLLAVSINGQFYLPCVDNNGNITAYIDEQGVIVAEYIYDAFGSTITATGSISDTFHHRFSTKYYDTETGLYYYGYRFYDPALHRWLNRDSINEVGGVNLYAFCGNNGVNEVDFLGLFDLYLHTYKTGTLGYT